MVVALWACNQSGQHIAMLSHEQAQQMELEDSLAFKVGVTPTLDCLPFFVMKEYHILDSTKVDIRLKKYTSQMDCDTAIMQKRVEMIVSDIIRIERMKAYGIEIDYFTTTNAKWQLYGNKKSDFKNGMELNGKKIALTRFSATSFLTSHLLKDIDTNVFLIQINDLNIRMQMLRNNELDAFWFAEPQATFARIENHPLLWGEENPEISLGVMAFRHDIELDSMRMKQFELLTKAYNTACDTIDKLGLSHFAPIIAKYCNVNSTVVDSLPALKYNRISLPQERDILAARKWLTKNSGVTTN